MLTKHVDKTFDQTWSNMIKLVQTWPNLIKFDQTWSNLTKLDVVEIHVVEKHVVEKHVVEKICCWKKCCRKICCWKHVVEKYVVETCYSPSFFQQAQTWHGLDKHGIDIVLFWFWKRHTRSLGLILNLVVLNVSINK